MPAILAPSINKLGLLATEELARTNNGKAPVLQFANQEPYWSTGYFTIPSGAATTAAGSALAAGTQRQIFQSKVGDAAGAQGGNWQFSYADTNNEVGTQFPRDQVFVAWGAGFEFALYTLGGSTSSPGAVCLRNVINITDTATNRECYLIDGDILQLANSLSWSVEEVGQIKRTYGLAVHFPSGTGVASTNPQRVNTSTTTEATTSLRGLAQNGGPNAPVTKLTVPLVLKPLVNVKHVLTMEKAVSIATSMASVADNALTSGLTGPVLQTAAYVGVKVTLFGVRFNVIGQ